MTRAEQLRFQRLVRHFVHNFFDNELLAPGGEAANVFVTAFALLGALGFTLSIMFSLKYGYALSNAKPHVLAWAGAADNLLVILMTMSLMGLLTVLAWDGLLPSSRDGHILGALPVKGGVIFRARLYATVLLFCLVMAAFAFFPGVTLPVAQATAGDWAGLARGFAAQLVSVVAAGGFVFFGAATLQSLLLAALPHARFVQASSVVQVTILVGSFAMFFLTPGMEMASKLGWDWVRYLPPYWFFGLWQTIGGGLWLYGGGPPMAAVASVAAAVVSSLTLSALLYRSGMRKAVEGMRLMPKGPGFFQRTAIRLLNSVLLREARERAVFWFAARTLARQRSHRLLLAIYLGFGLAWVLAGLSTIFTSDLSRGAISPNAVVCTIPVDLAAMLLIGMRVLFGMPVEVKANWLPRISVPESGGFAVGAARKLMVVAGILPMALLPLPLMGAAWGWRAAAVHSWYYLLETFIVMELLMGQFHKFPFACSWLPGQSNLKVKLGMYFFAFAGVSSFVGAMESNVLLRDARGVLITTSILLGGWLAWLIWRRRRAAVEGPPLSFEERPEFTVSALQLQ